ncbi:protein EARLY-RESPONSIVE TO DEHYDRATION 7, chloroplastic-like [Tasmannia lanceolata]|uniref:protein EARLY-RESPONSIVE TO DEHYDRATION 7, chloroplastic-like n=1 Tax=Tasmannia lanceolata TaxID=3420 RepID=UPI0040640BF2
MAYNQNPNPSSLYPEAIQSNPERNYPFSSSSSSLYPSIDSSQPLNESKPSQSSLYPSLSMKGLVENLFPDDITTNSPNPNPNFPIESSEETLIKISGAIVNLIDKSQSIQLATGDLTVVGIRQSDNIVAVLVRISDEIQWPLTKDEAAVKLDESHYFFSLHVPKSDSPDSGEEDSSGGPTDGSENLLNYGLTFASKGQEGLLNEFDAILEHYSSFSVQKVLEKKKSDVLDGSVAKEVSPSDLKSRAKKEMMEERSAAYWTTLAPNVEDYGGYVAKAIATGSGQLIKGILWCGDVTVDRLKWGDEILKRRMDPNSEKTEISRDTMKRIKRVRRVSKMSEEVVSGVLSGVVRVAGFFTSSVVNSRAGKKFFSLLPGEIVLASLDGFGKVCDAFEVAGKNVLSTSSTVTTGLVSHRYGEQAAELTNEGLDAAGHALGTAWAVFKIRRALNPKSVIKPSTIAKSAAKAAASSKSK